MFEFENISYAVGNSRTKKHILKNVSGQFSDGSMVAIMGPSGAGKTCLLKALSLGITSGKVYGSIKRLKSYLHIIQYYMLHFGVWFDLGFKETRSKIY